MVISRAPSDIGLLASSGRKETSTSLGLNLERLDNSKTTKMDSTCMTRDNQDNPLLDTCIGSQERFVLRMKAILKRTLPEVKLSVVVLLRL
jgi:hypothetical protein